MHGCLAIYQPLTLSPPQLGSLSDAVVVLLTTPPGYRLQLMISTTWKGTTANIVVLSSPSLLAVMNTAKGHAPTRPVVTGAAVGLLAGDQGVLVYTLTARRCQFCSAASGICSQFSRRLASAPPYCQDGSRDQTSAGLLRPAYKRSEKTLPIGFLILVRGMPHIG